MKKVNSTVLSSFSIVELEERLEMAEWSLGVELKDSTTEGPYAGVKAVISL